MSAGNSIAPLEEAREAVSRLIRNVIRVEIINRFQDNNIGLENIDDGLDKEAEELHFRMMSGIEQSYQTTANANPSEDGHKLAHYYYVACTTALVGYMLGFNAMR